MSASGQGLSSHPRPHGRLDRLFRRLHCETLEPRVHPGTLLWWALGLGLTESALDPNPAGDPSLNRLNDPAPRRASPPADSPPDPLPLRRLAATSLGDPATLAQPPRPIVVPPTSANPADQSSSPRSWDAPPVSSAEDLFRLFDSPTARRGQASAGGLPPVTLPPSLSSGGSSPGAAPGSSLSQPLSALGGGEAGRPRPPGESALSLLSTPTVTAPSVPPMLTPESSPPALPPTPEPPAVTQPAPPIAPQPAASPPATSTTSTPTPAPTPPPAPAPAPLSSQQAIGFHGGLQGWDIHVVGGSDAGQGSVTVGSAILREGDSFLVGLQQTFTVPEHPAPLVFHYTDLNFDTSDTGSIKDAFEASLVGPDGRTLVYAYAPGRDAFFNVTESVGLATGVGTTETGDAVKTVTVDMAGVFPGTQATVRFRLVNNDRDTQTSVRILDVLVPSDLPPTVTAALANDTAPDGPGADAYRTDGLTNDPRVTGAASDDLAVTSLTASVDGGPFQDITSSLVAGQYTFDPGPLAPGPHQAVIRAADAAGHATDAMLAFQVNHPPVAVSGGSRIVNEGDTIDFDGSPSADAEGLFSSRWHFAGGATQDGLAAQRTYPQDGAFSFDLTLTDTAGSQVVDRGTVTVRNLAPVVSAVAGQQVSEGDPVTIQTGFRDAGVLDTHTATVDWGDGVTGPALVIPGPNGTGTVSATHVYADNADYHAILRVADDAGDAGLAPFTVSVRNANPTVTAGLAFEVVPGVSGPQVGVVLSGSFTDPGFTRPAAGTAETLTVSIAWADGKVETVPAAATAGAEGVPTQGRFTARHVYAQPGLYAPVVTVRDDDTGAATAAIPLGVARLTVTRTIDVPKGGALPVLVLRDPGFDATLIDVNSVRFGPANARADNLAMQVRTTDVRFNFTVASLGFHTADTSAVLTGRLKDGTPFASAGAATVIGGAALPATSAAGSTKFFVADAAADTAYRYGSTGAAAGSFALDGVARDSRGIASNAAGDRVWVLDGVTQVVTVQRPDGALLGSWRAEGLQSPQGLTTDGTDVWVVDTGSRQVIRYAGAASLTSGEALPQARFALHPDNASPTDLVTDGRLIWVTDSARDQVFVYDLAGTLQGRWGLDPRNGDASGITRDPTGASSDLWVVDRVARLVFRYSAGSSFRDGARTAASTFALVATNGQPEAIADPPAAEVSYAQVPMTFEANQGQTDAQVRFLSRGSGYALFLTDSEAVLSLQAPAPAPTAPGDAPSPEPPSVLRMQLVGANPTTAIVGQDQQPGVVNYFRGNDPRAWQTGVTTYGKIAYQGVYPGVDVVYYGNQRTLEYDFVVGPGTDPGLITIRFTGADSLEIDGQGNLVLHTPGGDVVQHAPILYQESDGNRQSVPGGYVLLGPDEVGFQVGAYDPSRQLVIDPILAYSTYLGGSDDDGAYGLAVDAAGNAYVTGWTQSTDFPVVNAFQPQSKGGGTAHGYFSESFVSKINPTGNTLLFSTYIGGSGEDTTDAIKVDASGNIYIAGVTTSTDFPVVNALQPTLGGGGINAFVTKMNPTFRDRPTGIFGQLSLHALRERRPPDGPHSALPR